MEAQALRVAIQGDWPPPGPGQLEFSSGHKSPVGRRSEIVRVQYGVRGARRCAGGGGLVSRLGYTIKIFLSNIQAARVSFDDGGGGGGAWTRYVYA